VGDDATGQALLEADLGRAQFPEKTTRSREPLRTKACSSAAEVPKVPKPPVATAAALTMSRTYSPALVTTCRRSWFGWRSPGKDPGAGVVLAGQHGIRRSGGTVI
jgi:hypothetical protein